MKDFLNIRLGRKSLLPNLNLAKCVKFESIARERER
jgi:hypothetical protein